MDQKKSIQSEMERYAREYRNYVKNCQENERLQADIQDTDRQVKETLQTKSQADEKLRYQQNTHLEDFRIRVSTYTKEADEAVSALEKSYQQEVKAIKAEYNEAVKKNDQTKRTAVFEAEHLKAKTNLDEDEKKAASYAEERMRFSDQKEYVENDIQTKIEEAELSALEEINNLRTREQKIGQGYGSRIAKMQARCDEIADGYREEIAARLASLEHGQELKREELEIVEKMRRDAKLDLDAEESSLNDTSTVISRTYQRAIKKAKHDHQDYQSLVVHRDSRLQRVNDKKARLQKKYEARIAEADDDQKKIDEHYAPILSRLQSEYDGILSSMENALKDPRNSLQAIMDEKDRQIRDCENKIAKVQENLDQKVKRLNAQRDQMRQEYSDSIRSLDDEIKAYAAKKDNGYEQVLEEAYAPFAPLEERKEGLREITKELTETVGQKRSQKIYNKAYEQLAGQSFDQLQETVKQLEDLKNDPSLFYTSRNLVLGIILILGIILAGVLKFALKQGWAVSLFAGAVLILALFALYYWLMCRQLERYDLGLALGTEYRNLSVIQAWSSDRAVNEEVDRINESGEKIVKSQYGKSRAENMHVWNADRLAKDQERKLKFAKENAVKENNRILMEKDAKIEAYRKEYRKANHEQLDQLDELTRKSAHADEVHTFLKKQMTSMARRQHDIEGLIHQFEDSMKSQDFSEMTGLKGVFSDTLYLMSENSLDLEEKASKEVRPVMEFKYNRKNAVVLYDRKNIRAYEGEGAEEARIRTVQDILKTMAYGVKRSNGPDMYLQYIANNPADEDTDCFNNNEMRKKLRIRACVKLEDLASTLQEVPRKREMVVHVVFEPDHEDELAPLANIDSRAIELIVAEKNAYEDGIGFETVYSALQKTVPPENFLLYDNGNLSLYNG